MSRAIGSLSCFAECSRCGLGVDFTFEWDRGTNWSQVWDTAHVKPGTGAPCDLTESDIDHAIERADEARSIPMGD